MSKTRASCFIRGSRHLETIKALGLQPRAFICFSVSGTPDETRSTSFCHITWKYLLVKEENLLFCSWTVSRLIVWLCLQTQGKLLLANVNKENWSSNFFSQINGFWREHFHQVSYLLKILSMAKKWKKMAFQLLPWNQDFAGFFLTVALKDLLLSQNKKNRSPVLLHPLSRSYHL